MVVVTAFRDIPLRLIIYYLQRNEDSPPRWLTIVVYVRCIVFSTEHEGTPDHHQGFLCCPCALLRLSSDRREIPTSFKKLNVLRDGTSFYTDRWNMDGTSISHHPPWIYCALRPRCASHHVDWVQNGIRSVCCRKFPPCLSYETLTRWLSTHFNHVLSYHYIGSIARLRLPGVPLPPLRGIAPI